MSQEYEDFNTCLHEDINFYSIANSTWFNFDVYQSFLVEILIPEKKIAIHILLNGMY